MAELIKHTNNSLYYIRHALRELPSNKIHGNEQIDPSLSKNNYSLLDRCHTSKAANAYRLKLEKEIFRFKRKDLVHTIEWVIQAPDDCSDERLFFQTAYDYVCQKVLPMGESSVIVASVHVDEHQYITNAAGEKIDISKHHLHLIAVPAAPDHKHPEYEYKLSAHDLTTKRRLKQFHPGLQKACDDAGITATVYKKSSDGNTISLSVKQLKEITNKTGIVIDKTLTIDQLAELLKEHENIKLVDKKIQQKLDAYEEKISHLNNIISDQNYSLNHAQELIAEKDILLDSYTHKLTELQKQISNLQEQNLTMKNELEQKKSYEHDAWGNTDSWGTDSTWGEKILKEKEHLW